MILSLGFVSGTRWGWWELGGAIRVGLELTILDTWRVMWVDCTLSTLYVFEILHGWDVKKKVLTEILASIESSTPSSVVLFAFYFVNGSLLERCERSKERR